ncbi:MAG: type I DNA topoisomerase [Actinobacteria bacterium]|jgi:DNA topoisomerase-1|nr:type I DNA topoisomerase [Actinomycetota bacterium]
MPQPRTGPRSGTKLVVVESPHKARTIAGYLGDGYVVESSVGHIRDLPRGAADVPAKYKGEPWARLGVNVDDGFEPLYVIPPDKKQQVAKLKDLLKGADELFLATDEDREGEAIAWHLLQTLSPTVPVKRMVFHEITPGAIRAAVQHPRELDDDLVDAQETRRILDRLYGYEVSPVLWKKVMPRLSAGRVQSVATRIIVDRERARMAFVSGTYWGIDAVFAAAGDSGDASGAFTGSLASVDGTRLATGKDFDPATGAIKAGVAVLQLDEPTARAFAAALAGAAATVTSVEDKPFTKRPAPPFMTSTLQQEAGYKLHFSSERTMRTAQRLYEGGYITYMRTDSTTLSQTALDSARAQARELYGPEYVPDAPRHYTRKVKNAQEAHEAIRPAGDQFRTPGQVAGELSGDEFRLYELIWKRTIASQMADARGRSVTARIAVNVATAGAAGAIRELVFTASGQTITFPGYQRAYDDTPDDADSEATAGSARSAGSAASGSRRGGRGDDDVSGRAGSGEAGAAGAAAPAKLPPLAEGQALRVDGATPDGHTTKPPARYTEPSLVKALEEMGIGRPSTYASIIRTITDRGYVWRRGTALVPSWVAFAVIGLLERYFPRLVDYDFTAAMEDELDGIAAGRLHRTDWLSGFYFGGDVGPKGSVGRSGGLKHLVADQLDTIDAREVNSLPLLKDSAGRTVVVRVGRFGPYLERPTFAPGNAAGDATGGDAVGDTAANAVGDAAATERANLPDDLPPDELTPEVVEQLFGQAAAGDRELGVDPATGRTIVAKDGRYGPYVTEVLPEGTQKTGKNAVKPRTASLFKSMGVQTVTLDEALQLLTLPRVVGVDPESGAEITAQNGRYGPYLKKGTDSRSLPSEDALFTVTLDEALALYAQPKTRGRAAAAPPLKQLGADPNSGKPMVVKEGRFGPYVTDGETNASLRKSDSVEGLTDERAAELLAEKRAKGPAPARGRRTAAAGAGSRTGTATRRKTSTKAGAKK